jgi:hypothetical protein
VLKIRQRRADPLVAKPTEPALAPQHRKRQGFKYPMGQNFAAVPSLFIFVFFPVLSVTITALVVWPAVWSDQPDRRQEAYAILSCLLKFVLKICRTLVH